ncbi:right-handed parallel beta-helix repeat-containing protein [Halobacteria archaeon AArc-dxtr1]|nr:right-handed parallel beta-helix repeat-containing protein [Halobacteria archaeon AArc-dxtr1]
MSRHAVIWILALAVLLGGGALFVADTGASAPEPVPFDETVSVGLTLESELELSDDDDVSLPRTQAFYSQYQYVVGYYGVETFVDEQRQDGHEQRFGYTLAVYVTDYSDTSVALNEDGYPTTDEAVGWTDATDAWFVVGSDARTPSGETVVPFSDRNDAETFAAAHGGEIRTWEETLDEPFETNDAAVVRDRIDEQHQHADTLVESASERADRPVSTVVGDEVDTIQEGIDEAPENTTVVIPDGTYNETLEIDRPITLEGVGEPTIQGDENGSVVTITEPDVAVQNVELTGVGPVIQGAEEVPGESVDDWDDDFQMYYTGADAAVSAHVADGLLIEDVTVETPSNGIILRDSPDAVVRNVTVQGNENWQDGFAGVMAFRSPGVIESSTFFDGRDSIYPYRSEGIVVRDNTVSGGILGIHLMHTDGALVADNQITDVMNTGLFIMTGPERNAVVGNEISSSDVAANVGGSNSYVAGNTFEANDVGLRMDATGSIYEDNLLAGNQLGADDRALLPTNRVVGNDFVGNDEHATAGAGPLRVWSHDGHGNYWQGATSIVDGDPPSRSYSPTDAVDGRLHTTDGAATLARAPALDALAGLEESVSGMQTGSIVDTAPTCEPNVPELLERTDWEETAWTCDGTPASDSPP